MRLPWSRHRSAASSLEETLRELRDATFFAPTPWAIARSMLDLAEPQPSDVVYDLGSGDGRIPIMAAQEFGCRAVGIELDDKLCRHSEQKANEYGLSHRVEFRREDFFKAAIQDATVVTMYLLSQVNGHLGPRLASQLPVGARVVSLDYPIPGWIAAREIAAQSEGNVDYRIFLYRR